MASIAIQKIHCYDLAKWLSHYFILLLFYFILFSYLDLLQGKSIEKYHMTILHITVMCQDITRSCHMVMSHDKCGKVVYRIK